MESPLFSASSRSPYRCARSAGLESGIESAYTARSSPAPAVNAPLSVACRPSDSPIVSATRLAPICRTLGVSGAGERGSASAMRRLGKRTGNTMPASTTASSPAVPAAASTVVSGRSAPGQDRVPTPSATATTVPISRPSSIVVAPSSSAEPTSMRRPAPTARRTATSGARSDSRTSDSMRMVTAAIASVPSAEATSRRAQLIGGLLLDGRGRRHAGTPGEPEVSAAERREDQAALERHHRQRERNGGRDARNHQRRRVPVSADFAAHGGGHHSDTHAVPGDTAHSIGRREGLSCRSLPNSGARFDLRKYQTPWRLAVARDINETMNSYVTDMLALEDHIDKAIRGQIEELKDYPEVVTVLRDMHQKVERHISDLKALTGGRDAGGVTEAIKRAGSAVLGAAAGVIDLVRTEGLPKNLRDDYTALSLATSAT